MNQKLGSEVVFGHSIIPYSQIFLSRKNVFAIINHKPYLPGHVLVCSRKNVPKLSDLTEIQILDLFVTAQQILKKLTSVTGYSYNLSIQNGKDAGQTMFHTHIHICPISVPGGHVREEGEGIRTQQDMAIEAAKYRVCFQQVAN